MGKIIPDVNLPLCSPTSEMLRSSYEYKPLHIALKCQGPKLTCVKASCSNYLMPHNKLPQINGMEQLFIMYTVRRDGGLWQSHADSI